MRDIAFWTCKLRFACRQKQVIQSEIYAIYYHHTDGIRQHLKKNINFTSPIQRRWWETTQKYWRQLHSEKKKIETKITYIKSRLRALGQNDFDLYLWAWNSTALDPVRYIWPGPKPQDFRHYNPARRLITLTFANWVQHSKMEELPKSLEAGLIT